MKWLFNIRIAALILGVSQVFADDGVPAPAPRATSAPALSAAPGKPIQLFNGKNLDGWIWYQRPPKAGEKSKDGAPIEVVGIDKVWSVKDGVLHTTGKPTGYIRTEKSFASCFPSLLPWNPALKSTPQSQAALTSRGVYIVR